MSCMHCLYLFFFIFFTGKCWISDFGYFLLFGEFAIFKFHVSECIFNKMWVLQIFNIHSGLNLSRLL
jgi:hypothetical protein